MKTGRPLTAPRLRNKRQESKLIISGFKRPNSAKTHSLKQIISVIQNTLNQGAQVVLTKSKTMDKFSKVKQQVECLRRQNERKESSEKEIPQFPQYKTQFFIANSIEIPKSTVSVRSSKILSRSLQNDEFVPYSKQDSKIKKEEFRRVGMQKYGVKKLERKAKIVKEREQKEKQNVFGVLDGWENDKSLLNIDKLLEV